MLELKDYVIIVLSVLLVISFIGLVYLYKKAHSDKRTIINGERFSGNGSKKEINHFKGDVILSQGTEYTVKKKSELIPGIYTILSANEGVEAFNIRVGGFVREYKHGAEIVLKEGETITPISHSIILR